MLDNALFFHVRKVLVDGLAARDVDAAVKQNYQPTIQGVEDGPCLYYTKLPMDRRYGWPEVSDRWNIDQTEFIHTERQEYETTLQITAMLKELATDGVGALTASDLGNVAAAILQSDVARAYLAEQGLSVLRITQVQSGKIVDGEGEFETVPNFDLTVKHEQVSVTTTPAALVKALAVKSV